MRWHFAHSANATHRRPMARARRHASTPHLFQRNQPKGTLTIQIVYGPAHAAKPATNLNSQTTTRQRFACDGFFGEKIIAIKEFSRRPHRKRTIRAQRGTQRRRDPDLDEHARTIAQKVASKLIAAAHFCKGNGRDSGGARMRNHRRARASEIRSLARLSSRKRPAGKVMPNGNRISFSTAQTTGIHANKTRSALRSDTKQLGAP